MIGIILGITIPIAYILIGALIARYVARNSSDLLVGDEIALGLLIGLFWPITLPFYIALKSEVH